MSDFYIYFKQNIINTCTPSFLPCCERAKILCEFKKKLTLNLTDLKILKKLGLTIMIENGDDEWVMFK